MRINVHILVTKIMKNTLGGMIHEQRNVAHRGITRSFSGYHAYNRINCRNYGRYPIRKLIIIWKLSKVIPYYWLHRIVRDL